MESKRATGLRKSTAIVCAIGIGFWAFPSQADERLWIDATINGKSARLAFDSGLTHTALFPKGASRLGLTFTNGPRDVTLGPGQIPLGSTEECEITLGRTTFRDRMGIIEVPSALPMEMDGVVGWPTLSNNVLKIDAQLGMMVALPKVPETTTNWLNFKLRTSDILLIEVPAVDGKPILIFVDTGSEGGVRLVSERWRQWKTAHKNQPMTLEASFFPAAGLLVKEEAWAKQLSFGPFLITDVPVQEAIPAEAAMCGADYAATFGLTALKRLDLIIDGKRGVACVQLRKTPPADYEHNRLGAVFVPVNMQSEDLIAHVVEGSPAYEAGIREGDVLMRIGELDTTKWQTDPAVLPLTRFWTQPVGTKLELALRRGKQTLKVTPVLRQILSAETAKD